MVAALCGLLLRDHSETEDATQQTFLSAYRALLRGVEPREPAAWLATIARNECRTRVRNRMRVPLPVELPDEPGAADALDDAIRRLDLRALWTAIAALPARQRQAFLLRELGGLSYDELAEALAVSTPAVESLLLRARATLRTALRPLEAVAPALGRIVSWPFAAKVAATAVGASLVAGSTAGVSRHDGGPARRDPSRAPVAVDRPAPRPVVHVQRLALAAPAAPVHAAAEAPEREVQPVEAADPPEAETQDSSQKTDFEGKDSSGD